MPSLTLVGLLGLFVLFGLTNGHVPRPRHSHLHSRTHSAPPLVKRAGNPADFTWVKRWAVIGDSYTAGIGSGAPLGRGWDEELQITLPNGMVSGHGDWYCSRYDMSYPMIVDRMFGSHVEDFQFLACSGDRTGQIFQQAQHLKGNLDLLLMTAGGNDLCLVGESKREL